MPPGLAVALIGTSLVLLNSGIDELGNPRLRDAVASPPYVASADRSARDGGTSIARIALTIAPQRRWRHTMTMKTLTALLTGARPIAGATTVRSPRRLGTRGHPAV